MGWRCGAGRERLHVKSNGRNLTNYAGVLKGRPKDEKKKKPLNNTARGLAKGDRKTQWNNYISSTK